MMSRRKLLWDDERGADVSFLDGTLQPSEHRQFPVFARFCVQLHGTAGVDKLNSDRLGRCHHARRVPMASGTRRLLHSDITASLSKAGEVLVAAGGDGTTYFVSNRSMDVTLEAVEIEGMGRAGSRNPLLELALPGAHFFSAPAHDLIGFSGAPLADRIIFLCNAPCR